MEKLSYALTSLARGIRSSSRKTAMVRRNLSKLPHVDLDTGTFGFKVSVQKKHGTPSSLPNTYKDTIGEMKKFLIPNNLKSGVYQHGNSGVKHVSEVAGVPLKQIPGRDREAINRIITRHEHDEIKTFKSLKKKYGSKNSNFHATYDELSHVAPSIMLRESANIKGLDPNLYRAREVLKQYHEKSPATHRLNELLNDMRSPKLGGSVFKNKGNTGDTNRFVMGRDRMSRHAYKRLDEASVRKGHIKIYKD